MKKEIYSAIVMLLAIAAPFVMLSACDDDDEEVTDELSDSSSDSSSSDTDDGDSDTDESCTVNGYDAVDLGLSVKWATINIGASGSYWAGSYFAWGEPSSKGSFKEDNSKTYGISMEDISGDADYDAATNRWGSPWRMPTYDETKELTDNCTWTWKTNSYLNGYLVEGPNGNSIFLPLTGSALSTGTYSKGETGYYWTSTPYDDEKAYVLFLAETVDGGVVYSDRYKGAQVRPVTD